MAWFGPIERLKDTLRAINADVDAEGRAYVRGVVVGLGEREVIVNDDATVKVNGEYVPLRVNGAGVLVRVF